MLQSPYCPGQRATGLSHSYSSAWPWWRLLPLRLILAAESTLVRVQEAEIQVPDLHDPQERPQVVS